MATEVTDLGSYWSTKADRREKRRKNARKMRLSGTSARTLQQVILKRANKTR